MESQKKEVIKLVNEEEWLNLKCGKITASEIWKIMKKGRSSGKIFSDTGETYLMEKIADMICGYQKTIGNAPASLDWGKRHEPEAVEFMRNRGWIFEHYGGSNYVFFPWNNYSGSSPDGLDPTHIHEIKCPYTSYTHLENLIASKNYEPRSPELFEWLFKERYEYLMQIHFNMMCCQREHAYFISYDPRVLNEDWRLAVMEISLDEEIAKEMKLRIDLAREIIVKGLNSLR